MPFTPFFISPANLGMSVAITGLLKRAHVAGAPLAPAMFHQHMVELSSLLPIYTYGVLR